MWRRNVTEVPRLGRSDRPERIAKDLAEVLSMDGLSSSYSIRHLMGRQYLEHLNIFLTAGFFEDVWDILADTPQERLALMRLRTIKRRSLATWWANQQQAATPLSSAGVLDAAPYRARRLRDTGRQAARRTGAARSRTGARA